MQKLTAFYREHADLALAAACALLAFALRYWFFWNYPYPLMLHEQDGIAYMAIARDLLAFKTPGNLFMPPFYPLVIAIFSILPVQFEVAARLAAITMDSLVVLPLFGLARIFLPRIASLAVCVLWASFGFSLFFSASPLSQPTYLCMLFTGIYLLYLALTGEARRRWLFAVAGACFSAAYQSRPEGVVAIAGAFLLVAAGMLRKDADRRYHLQGAAIMTAVFLLCALPYLLLLRNSLGHWTFTGKTNVAIKGIDGSLVIGSKVKGGLEMWLEEFGGIRGGIGFIGSNIAAFFKTLVSLFPPAVHLFALIGIPFVFCVRNFYSRLFYLLPMFVTLPVYVAKLPNTPSYIYPLFPIYMLFFIAGVWGVTTLIMKWLKQGLPSIRENLLSTAAAAVLLIPTVILAANGFGAATRDANSPELLFQVEKTNKVYKAAGEDIKAVSKPTDPVMTRWGLVSYFAERPYVGMPKGSIEDVLDAGRKSNARFILIDTESVLSRRQELTPLLAPLAGNQVDPRYGLEVVSYRITNFGEYVVYRYR